jgi:hypothetical protein
MNLPPAFALSRAQIVAQQILVRDAVTAVIEHTGNTEHLDALCAELAVATALRKLALAQIKTHLVPAEQLGALAVHLIEAEAALLGVKERHTRTGVVGCDHEQKQALLGLAAIVDTMRDNLPRRLWVLAIRSVFEKLR